ncbi:hypothetical protein ABT090_24670 [Streptomyces asoensis]|uniref:hypothetical protein n=1 Tax=Streptomyces asoensis TaxID=249586 RepID=UPI00332F24AD
MTASKAGASRLSADDSYGLDAETTADLVDLFAEVVDLTRAVLDATRPEDRGTVTRALDDVLGDMPVPGTEDLDP